MQCSGTVVKLDRGFPLIRTQDGGEFRCKHATAYVKGGNLRAVIGDRVVVDLPDGADMAQIIDILPRKNQFIRKDPAERAIAQVLAANFDTVIIAHPLSELNIRRLERELVLAHETGAR
ncbi:MAG: ribosome small subunit-dependent GTPase, partial [Coriobacteriaceae bacterium]|nr:ribosome small subunit-dependent GTPase [Coriobacteriaceae bacterium]